MDLPRTVLIILSLILTTGVQARDGADIQTIAMDTLAVWNEALNNKDASAFSSLFTYDALLLPPRGESVAGIQEIYDFVNQTHESGVSEHKVSVTGVTVRGAHIFVTGEWTAADRRNEITSGHLFYILEKQMDGSWRARFIKWNLA